MSLGYCNRNDGIPLKQGDILRQIPRPHFEIIPFQKLVEKPDGCFKPVIEERNHILHDDFGIASYDLVDAIMLSQSCDIAWGHQVLAAPLEEITIAGKSISKKGKKVNDLINNLGVIRHLYLPDLPNMGFKRHIALLTHAYTLDSKQLTEYVKVNNNLLMGLSDKGVEYLQYRIAQVFGRLAREDFSWASLDDIALILAHEIEFLRKYNNNGDGEKVKLQEEKIHAINEMRTKIKSHLTQEFKKRKKK